MAIRKLARMGNPVLRKENREITPEEIQSDDFKKLLADMVETLVDSGGIGLAAPQIHENCKVALIAVEEGEDITVFINPTIKIIDETLQGNWEGCLSVPNLRGFVERPRAVEVTFTDHHGQIQKCVYEDFPATVVQHELDHLQGILYVDKLKDSKLFSYNEEHDRYF